MKASVAEAIDRVRPQAGVPLIVCDCRHPTSQDGPAPLWIFRERAPNRLRQRWSGVLTRPEADELVQRLRQQTSIWMGGIDSYHDPPSRRFRLVWTLPPAPCRIYTRRGLAVDVEPALVTRRLSWRRERFAVPSSSVVEGWIRADWTCSGICLKGPAGEESEILRVKNANLFEQFLLMYDGIDLMIDVDWLERVVPRVAEVLGLAWRIVDFTAAPPKIVGEGAPAPATGRK
jgi:hypothetical protein